MEKPVRLIASDIDGTLLPEGTRDMNPEFYDLVRELIEKDIIFVAASGRDLNSIKTVFAPVQEDIIFMPNNGGQIICQGMELYSAFLSKEMCQAIEDYIGDAKDVHVLLTSDKNAYTTAKDKEWLAWLDEGYGLEIKRVNTISEIEERIVKFSAYYVNEEASDMAAPAKAHFGDSVGIMAAGEHWLDFVGPNVSKGSALEQLQKRMGISPEETMSFGDNFNDIAMLQQASRSFAVATAKDEVKEAATAVLPDDKDAVMKEIKKWI